MYGGNASGPQLCPGESNCDKWAGSMGKIHTIKERNVCHPCPMFGTKTDAGKQNHQYLSSLANRAMHIRYERIAGYPPSLDQIQTVEHQTLIMIERFIEAREIEVRQETQELLTAFFKSR